MRAHVLTLTLAIACVFTLSGVALAQVLTLPPLPSTGGPPDLFRAAPDTYTPRIGAPAPHNPVRPWYPPIASPIPPIAPSPSGRANSRSVPPAATTTAGSAGTTLDLFLAGPETYAPHYTEPFRGPRFYIVLPRVNIAYGSAFYTVVGPRRCISNRLSDCLSVLPRQARPYGPTSH